MRILIGVQFLFSDFSFLPQMTVYTVLFHWNLEHLRCGCAVDVASFFKNILAPGFSRKPCQHSGFNGGKVGNDKLAAAFRHKCGADQLRQGIWHILIEYFQSIKVTGADQAAGLGQIRKMVLRQILHLNNASLTGLVFADSFIGGSSFPRC